MYRLAKSIKSLPIGSLAPIPVSCRSCSFSCSGEDIHFITVKSCWKTGTRFSVASKQCPACCSCAPQHCAWAASAGYKAVPRAAPPCPNRHRALHGLGLPGDECPKALAHVFGARSTHVTCSPPVTLDVVGLG